MDIETKQDPSQDQQASIEDSSMKTAMVCHTSAQTEMKMSMDIEIKPNNRDHAILNEDPYLKADVLGDTSNQLQVVETKLDMYSESMSKKLERIAFRMGIRNLNVVDNSASDAEDRKRLMEKLKSAFDTDRRYRIGRVASEQAMWLEYIFGICKPDQRIGQRGSRYRLL